MNGGAMDRYASGDAAAPTAKLRDRAAVGGAAVPRVARGVRARRSLLPARGRAQSSANDMYFAEARFVFPDNAYKPAANGARLLDRPVQHDRSYTGRPRSPICSWPRATRSRVRAGIPAMRPRPTCPAPPSDCAAHLPTSPCDYDPSDVPFEYYAQFTDDPAWMKDFDDLARDVAAQRLPSFAFVKASVPRRAPGLRHDDRRRR